MKVFLMHRDADFALEQALPANEAALTQDLELDTVCAAMAAGDPLLWQVARRALLCSLRDPDAILYRQAVLGDCLANPTVVRELYALAGDALQAQRSVWGAFSSDSPRTILSVAVKKMELFVGFLRRLHAMTDEQRARFASPGFTRLFAMLATELDEEYFALIDSHLKALTFNGGMLISARLGAGNRGTGYTLRQGRERGWLERAFDRSGYTFTIPDRDDNGMRALGKLEDRGCEPRRQRAGPVSRPCPELLHDAACRGRLLYRVPQPARPPRRQDAADGPARAAAARRGRAHRPPTV
jgi:hypothetical protein